MAKRVFFSFDFQDVADFRANVVRSHWMTKPDRESAGFFDASIWEAARKTGDVALKRLINSSLEGTTVTCVLVGSETYARRWVRYEILKSFRRGNKILAVHINSIRDKNRMVKPLGPNPFDFLGVRFSSTGETGTLLEFVEGQWRESAEIEGRASYLTGGMAQEYRGKAFQLSVGFPVYDWVADDGYHNFAQWIG
ncbi:MAG: TIR domain-containing protein [Candidatus Eisenbacteria bacterium]|nr:TIR domain-containing protein [Candidatus Eisenbacteria bacterium]